MRVKDRFKGFFENDKTPREMHVRFIEYDGEDCVLMSELDFIALLVTADANAGITEEEELYREY